jgi:hypothetical protein
VILAGYEDRMDDFFRLNPGMSSRVAHHINFPDYDLEELMAIAELMLTRERYRLTPEAQRAFREYLELRIAQPRFAHARSVRNAIERARLRQANRIYIAARDGGHLIVDDLGRIEPPDIRASSVFKMAQDTEAARSPSRMDAA